MKGKKKQIDLDKDIIETLDDEELAVLERHGLIKRDAHGKLIPVQELKVK